MKRRGSGEEDMDAEIPFHFDSKHPVAIPPFHKKATSAEDAKFARPHRLLVAMGLFTSSKSKWRRKAPR